MADILLKRALIRAAILQGAKTGATAKAVFEAIILGNFTNSIEEGRTLISTSGGGVAASFTLPRSLDPAQILRLAEECLEMIEAMPDPDNPTLSARRISKLRVSFEGATL